MSRPDKRLIKSSVCDSGAIALFIMEIPTKSIPKPKMMEPISRTRCFLKNRYKIAPANKISGAYALKLKAVSCAVIVVPILAPIMTPMACVRLRSPELTKPMTMTSVAEELWIIKVTSTPTATAIKRLLVAFSRMTRSLSPAALRSPDDINVIP